MVLKISPTVDQCYSILTNFDQYVANYVLCPEATLERISLNLYHVLQCLNIWPENHGNHHSPNLGRNSGGRKHLGEDLGEEVSQSQVSIVVCILLSYQ